MSSKSSGTKQGPRRIQVSLVDVRRAYFNAKIDQDAPVYVRLPSEDPMCGVKCGKLNRHLYGTRGVAAGWESEYSQFLMSLGFERGIASGCLFFHRERNLRCAVYGDDFTVVGACEDLDWYEQQMQNKYEVTLRGRLGPGRDDSKEMTLLNRIVRWTEDDGIEIEADPRQAERLVEQLNLEGANPVSTPGVKETSTEVQDDVPIYDERAKVYQAATARSNFMASDRPENQFATKETCRSMSAPTESAYEALKRLGRFVAGRKRLVIKYAK